MKEREGFSSKLGFVLAAAGSAVGLGNIWRFPYLVAKYGGGIFLLVYLILVLTFGYSIMTLEIAIGRKTKQSPIGAYSRFGKKFAWVGLLTVIIPFLISGYYSVIGGWVIKYLVVYFQNLSAAAANSSFFADFTSKPVEPIVYQVLFILVSAFILAAGVKSGVERASKMLMPLLVVLSLFVAVYTITLPGSLEGVKYILIPDFSNFGFETIVGALGQMFYSMSLAMGIMITYGSYLSKKDDIEKNVRNVEIFDTAIAIIATFMIVPAVFAFDKTQLNQGPGLMFITLPKVFAQIPLGTVVGGAFFVLVAFAALTSYISILEVLISSVCDLFKIKRKYAVALCVVASCLLGIPSSLGFGVWSDFTILGYSILDFFDTIANSFLLPIAAFVTCVIFGWLVGLKPIHDEIELSSAFRRKKIFNVIIRYIGPVFLAIIVITNILQIIGIVSI